MERIDIVETDLTFVKALSHRDSTDMIVIHHTGSVRDVDFGAEKIHEMHINQGWAGIGYHFVIRKDGTIERGRPEWAVGSHAYGENSHTIGIHLSGDFNAAEPTEIQIEHCAILVANLCEDYGIPTDRDHIVGHGELDPEVTPKGCPGLNLADKLDLISGKANWYRYGPPEVQTAKEAAWREDLQKIQQELSDEERIWNFLKGKGLNNYAAAGVMGNLYAESGLVPTNLENYYEDKLGMSDAEYTAAVDDGSYSDFVHDSAGYGIAQWTYWSRKQGLLELVRSRGVSIGDLDAQLEYLWQEMQSYHDMMTKLRNATSVQEASNAVLLDFERPADQSEAVQYTRARYGQEFYEDYAIAGKFAPEQKEENEMRYNTVDEMPDWAKPTIEKMIAKGLLGGTGGTDALDLSMDMIRTFVINDRAGLYQ